MRRFSLNCPASRIVSGIFIRICGQRHINSNSWWWGGPSMPTRPKLMDFVSYEAKACITSCPCWVQPFTSNLWGWNQTLCQIASYSLKDLYWQEHTNRYKQNHFSCRTKCKVQIRNMNLSNMSSRTLTASRELKNINERRFNEKISERSLAAEQINNICDTQNITFKNYQNQTYPFQISK